ncbi:MAG: hypothetical protein PWP08_1855 [Methanofollis sp.]|nr:hypothetical protein [Methanofollis sp.]
MTGLLLAWGGLSLAWSGAVERTDPASLAPVLAGTVLIFLPVILRTWSEDRERLTDRAILAVRCGGIAAGCLVGGGILYLMTAPSQDPKLHLVFSPVLAAVAGVLVLIVLEKAAIAVLERGKEK